MTARAILTATIIFFTAHADLKTIEQNMPDKKHLKSLKILNSKELMMLVTNNSMVGLTCRTKSIYYLYFQTDGTVIFQKNSNERHYGEWSVRDNHIYSQWKTYKKKPSKNELEYRHLYDNVYILYNVNDACGPANSFGNTFMVFKGNVYNLH